MNGCAATCATISTNSNSSYSSAIHCGGSGSNSLTDNVLERLQGTEKWKTLLIELQILYKALRSAYDEIECDYHCLLVSLTNYLRTGIFKSEQLLEKIKSVDSYISVDIQTKLSQYQSEQKLVEHLKEVNSSQCSPYLKITIKRLHNKIGSVLDDISLIQEDISYVCQNELELEKPMMSQQELIHHIQMLEENLSCKYRSELIKSLPSELEDRVVFVTRAFISEIMYKNKIIEKDNKHLRESVIKLKKVLRQAKEQRQQLKDLARRLKQERDKAVADACHRMVENDQLCSEYSQVSEQDRPNDEACDMETQNSVAQSSDCSEIPICPSNNNPVMEITESPKCLADRDNKVRIFVRVRPESSGFLKIENNFKIVVNAPLNKADMRLSFPREFFYDRVFDDYSTNASIFSAMKEMVLSCSGGCNVCVLAYGQTGSGKTFTMLGSRQNPGVNRLTITSLLETCASRPRWEYSFQLSVVEIYQEELRDLLYQGLPPANGRVRGVVMPSSHCGTGGLRTLKKIISSDNGDIIIPGLTEMPVTSEHDVDRGIALAERARIYSTTNLNETSSRSHVILMLKVRGCSLDDPAWSLSSTLTLCDLAGSENVVKSGVRGRGLCEASAINKSLLSLGKVFESLRRRGTPCYRESKLTRLLKPHLTKSSKCLVIVTVRQDISHFDETLRSLIFGQNAMQTKPEEQQKKKHYPNDSSTAMSMKSNRQILLNYRKRKT